MPQSAYPTAADVQTGIEEQGLTAPSNLAQIVDGVIADFKRKTGHNWILADAAASTWAFDPPYTDRGFVLDFKGAFVSVTSISIDGSAVDADGYDLLPLSAAGESRGWTEVRFHRHPGSLPASVSVVGKRGLYSLLPDDLYDALFNRMMRKGIASASQGLGPVQRVKQGGVEVEFATGKDGQVLKLSDWDSDYVRQIRAHVRM